MIDPNAAPISTRDATELFETTRKQTHALVRDLAPEDMMLQSMSDASPAKWHLAHTTWFFEEFILKPRIPSYSSPDDRFAFLFNSYYVQAGPRHARDKRGLISRPVTQEVMDYRAHVEGSIIDLLGSNRTDKDEVRALVELGCHHEMQHQELLVTDLLHGFSFNPLMPAYRDPEPQPVETEQPLSFALVEGGLTEIGHDGGSFHYDCEAPRHTTYTAPFQMAQRGVTNRDWIAFMEDGGYENPSLWLMEGWDVAQRNGWDTPLYWWKQDDVWWTYTLRGAQQVNLDAPVVHVSYYEAEAFARWAGARLPTETEHEIAFRDVPIEGNFLESEMFHPRPSANGKNSPWGDVWEWTQSPFTPYPGFRPPEGALGEYNGKFMISQMVLRGGSCATPRAQMRPTYRTFFYPHQRWQMMGLRLAKDV